MSENDLEFTEIFQSKTIAQLEEFGRSLSLPQLENLLDLDQKTIEEHFDKFLAILVGISPQNFEQLLSVASNHQLHTLLTASSTEPVQYQLSALIHELSQRHRIEQEKLDHLFQNIKQLTIEQLNRQEISEIENSIHKIAITMTDAIGKIQKGLKLAWNSNRGDLVENLSTLNDRYVLTLHHYIGHPASETEKATGLYELLGSNLNSLFAHPQNEHESAMEVLTKFSIWYLKDYWEIGLLPQIISPKQLELDPHSNSQQECLEYREELFAEIQKNLEKLKLHTLQDFKAAHIFSKYDLLTYVQQNIALLN